jgi:lipopolysaccharide/colanic/teichoic acid biosynthesis glycosyltransferase
MKRVFDVVVATIALVVLSPLMVAAAVAVWADSAGPVLFRQRRVGRDGREFMMYKFRSMVTDAASAGPFFTQRNDARITRVGRLLRRTSVDELPQLLNVLLGDMSLVGPRPDVPQQRSLYSDADWRLRCSVRPGITGLAQARLRSEATPEQRLALDLQYAREHDLPMDFRILALTVRRLSGHGAN